MKHPEVIPLREGRVSLKDQAVLRGLATPVGKTVEELCKLGYDVDPSWERGAMLREDEDSPTGYVIVWPFNENAAIYALAH